ncbi:alpha-glucosidase [Entomospira nematocerorum]|uniref:Alpha-glucosidase n=1 Tax=Entomospira nematocerorum TaxID=2719987 RepID=A0A968KTC9_9SPIO|nr:alpha-glucosidase [Entomospira nematocera]NIZ47281.1 alpha-glucosidase [Entomospira nematocera]WDI34177.1 alpha-glucosidase [Entomospira nematocera]
MNHVIKTHIDKNLFQLYLGDQILLEHTPQNPMLYIGQGKESLEMYRGNFKISDYLEERQPLTIIDITQESSIYTLRFDQPIILTITLEETSMILAFSGDVSQFNRFWLRLRADAEEKCYGGGEQMSYFNLRGRHFPIWTSEPGVGRDKKSHITWQADVMGMAGGDYYNSNFPQPSFISTKRYYLHINSTAYSDLDFRNQDFHEVHVWEIPTHIRIEVADDYLTLLERLTAYLGRQPLMPTWVHDGLILGLQGGSERVLPIMQRVLDLGVPIAAIWCQDWSGKRVTSFGKRIHWDWIANEAMYPDLKELVRRLNEQGIRFMNYLNPYLVKDGKLYQEAKELGYFATKHDGGEYLVDFGEFDCGVIDFTNPKAHQWFKEVIQKYTIDLGISGWMADFGEYLPVDDIKLHNGNSAMIEHNHWPTLWAKCNFDAVSERNKWDEIFYFMRAGGSGVQGYCPMLWAGDQSVDFSLHDGIATVITGALSAGMSGFGISHSDIGGYTSLFENIRTKELYLRWVEMSAFSALMRTHEGNRPDTNFQFYDDEESILITARMVKIYRDLKPYIRQLIEDNSTKGLPVQRPLFLHYAHDANTYDLQYQYLLGSDMIVAPVYLSQHYRVDLYLPEDEWIHLWSGTEMTTGYISCQAPIGYPAVFYRKASPLASLFANIGKEYGGIAP